MLSIARPQIALHALVGLACLAVVVGCAQPSPTERVEEARAATTVELRSFAVREEPIEVPVADETSDGEGAEGENEGAQDADDATTAAATDAPAADAAPADETPAAPVPVTAKVDLDLLVSTAADEPLEGITVEFEHVDADENVKDTRLLWVATPNLMRGVGAQYTVTVEDVDYVEGDGFAVTVRSPVPEAERSQYREFQGVGES